MALTVDILRTALRLGETQQEMDEITRLRTVAETIVEKRAPNAPDSIKDEAAIRIAGYLFDKPNATAGDGFAAIIRNSSAGDLLLPWTEIRGTRA